MQNTSEVVANQHPIQEQYDLLTQSDGTSTNVGATLLTLLKVVALIVTAMQVGVCIYFVINKNVHMHMFTWWNQVFFTCFLLMLVGGLFFQRWLLWFVVVFVLPFQTGLTTIVSVAIVILIKENPDLLMGGSTYEGGNLTMDMIHTGDWILHNCPVVILYFALFVSGLWLLARVIIGTSWRQFDRMIDRLVYCIFFLCAPLLPLAVYSIFIGIHKNYPTNIPDYILWLGLLSIAFAIQGLVFLSFVLTSHTTIEVPKITTITRPRNFFAELSLSWTRGTTKQPTHNTPNGTSISSANVFVYAR